MKYPHLMCMLGMMTNLLAFGNIIDWILVGEVSNPTIGIIFVVTLPFSIFWFRSLIERTR